MGASRGGCGGSAPSYDPCAGKACGDACRVCAPDAADCVETMEVKACDPTGRCTSAGTFTCGAYDPCVGKACGADCTYDPPCRLSDPPCMLPSYAGKCSADGACVPGDVTSCDPVGGCPGQPCGSPCNPSCPMGEPCPDLAACDGNGHCVSPATLVCPQPPDPCAGKNCGDSCGYCPPDVDPSLCPVPTFAPTACNASGECVTEGTFTCETLDPCAGKACGAECFYEPPCRYADPPCLGAPSYWGQCDPNGECMPPGSPSTCGPMAACDGKACGDACNPCAPSACMGPLAYACDPVGQCVLKARTSATTRASGRSAASPVIPASRARRALQS